MFERLDQIEARYEELTQALASPDIVNDSARYQKTAKAHSEIVPIVEKYREYKDLTRGIAESKAMLAEEKDPEMRAYAQEELNKLEPRVGSCRLVVRPDGSVGVVDLDHSNVLAREVAGAGSTGKCMRDRDARREFSGIIQPAKK